MSEDTVAPHVHETTHDIHVDAPADAVYALLADVTRWPVMFGPTIHAEQVERTGDTEVIRLWATAGGGLKTWTSRRELDRDRLRITFRQAVSQHPVESMTGAWVLRPAVGGGTDVVLEHTFTAVGDTPENVGWITEAVDVNSRAELANLAQVAAGLADAEELTTTFADTVEIDGDPADVYSFLYRSQDWPDRLPHVARLHLTEDTPNLQIMEMDTTTPGGAVHTTRSVRVCFPSERIVYKQLVPPALMSVHNGRWLLEPTARGVRVTSEHTVVVRPPAVATVLGEGATIADAKAFARTALGANSTTTLRYAKVFAEERRGG